MQYLGGKFRVSKSLSYYINSRLSEGQTYWEPFCGSCWTTCLVGSGSGRRRVASDVHPDLMALWVALQEGWEPPDEISEAEYRSLRHAPCSPLRGFVGFGSSFGGKFFGGYARGHKSNYATAAKRALLRKMTGLGDVEFICGGYREVGEGVVPVGGNLVYCDPPYIGTTGYSGAGSFEHAEFWEWVRGRSRGGDLVLVSEYTAPADFKVVWELTTKTDIRTGGGTKSARVERLFEWCGE